MQHIRTYSIMVFLEALISDAPLAQAGWKQVPSPNVGMSDNRLSGIAANSARDIWAVGTFAPDSNPNTLNTLTEHFDGTSWSVVSSPAVGFMSQLFAVAAKQGKAWAVGCFTDSSTFTTRTLIEAWNGSKWQAVSSPSPGSDDILFGAAATSPTDVWAVGYSMNSQAVFQTLIEHFDGMSWSIVPSPSPGSAGNQLYSVVAISPTSAWTVGQQLGSHDPDQTLIEHWNGTTWSVVSGPVTSTNTVTFFGVSAVSDDDVRGVGEANNYVNNPRTMIEDGQNGSFAFQTSPNIAGTENHLFGISSLSNDAAWAVGTYLDQASGNMFTLTMVGGDTGWKIVPSPNPGAANGDSGLGSVLALSSSDVWAVGIFDGPLAAQTLILHFTQ